jgi:hypothetical protein
VSAKRTKPIVLKKSEIRKSVRKPAAPPARRHQDKRKQPVRGKVRGEEEA